MATRRIKGQAIDRALKALDKLPELPRKERTFSTREAVEALTQQIFSLRDRGYSMERISAELKKCDVDISPSTLQRYLRTPKAPEADPAPQASAPAQEPSSSEPS